VPRPGPDRAPLDGRLPDGPKGRGVARRAAPAGAAWVRRHRTSIAYLSPVLVLTAVVHGVGMSAFPGPVDDEGTYVAQAWSVAIHHALTPYTYWYTHPPFGWIQIAGWALLTDGFRPTLPAVAMGRQLMLVAFVVSAGLVYVVVRRLGVRHGWAVAAVAVFGLSPLSVVYDRMAYLDNMAVPWLLAAFALALHGRLRTPGR
jgi:4-amino-4-deoxy-L-arabinose transferase-like glycosyltransferase